MNEHTYKQFDAEIEAIRSGVLAMGGLVESQLSRAIARPGRRRGSRRRSTRSAPTRSSINQMQVNLDQMCSQIIAKRQPAAIDLRFILMITKIVNELERVGDEAKKIAYKAAQIRGADRLSHVRHYDVIRAAERAREHAADGARHVRAARRGRGGRGDRRATRRSTPRSWRSCASSSAT